MYILFCFSFSLFIFLFRYFSLLVADLFFLSQFLILFQCSSTVIFFPTCFPFLFLFFYIFAKFRVLSLFGFFLLLSPIPPSFMFYAPSSVSSSCLHPSSLSSSTLPFIFFLDYSSLLHVLLCSSFLRYSSCSSFFFFLSYSFLYFPHYSVLNLSTLFLPFSFFLFSSSLAHNFITFTEFLFIYCFLLFFPFHSSITFPSHTSSSSLPSSPLIPLSHSTFNLSSFLPFLVFRLNSSAISSF